MSTQTLTFDNYVLYEFYITIQKKLDQSEFDESTKQLFHKFTEKMINFSDAMAPIEHLSTYQSTSELTIMLMDLFEFASIQEADELVPSLSEKADSFIELTGLMLEEDGFLSSIQNYVNEQSAEINAPDEEITSESQDSFENKKTVITQEIVEKAIPPINELNQVESSESSDDKVAFFEALRSETISRLGDLSTQKTNYISRLFDQINKKEELLNTLLPSEVSNCIIIISELVSSGGKQLYANCSILKQNIESIETDFLNDLEKNDFDILQTIQDDTQEAIEAIPQIKKPEKKSSIDQSVKEKVRKYFQNEVLSSLDDVQEIIDSVQIHEIIHEQFTKLKTVFTELKNVSIIHGYEGIQTVSSEFTLFLNECIEGDFVFTETSKASLQTCIDSFKEIVKHSDSAEEVNYVKSFFEHINSFNESLAILEIVEQECYPVSSSEVRNSFFKIVQGKYGLVDIVTHKLLKNAIADYGIYEISSNIELYQFLLSKPETTLNEFSKSIIDSFLYEISKSDIESIKSELMMHTQKKIQSRSPEEKHAQIKEEKYSFDEIKERNGIFESVLLKKLDKLITHFKNGDSTKIVHLSDWIEIEARLMGYEQIADLFNYYTINIDKIQPKKSDLLREFDKIKKSPANYEFFVDLFEGHEIQTNSEKQSEKQTKKSDLEEIDDSIREVFSDEAESYINELEDQLRTLKSIPDNTEALFKGENAAHTLRGAAKILQLEQIGALAGHIEIIFEKSEYKLDENQIVEIENRLDTIKKLVGIFKPNSNSESDDLLDSGQDDEMMDIFRDESETELKHIEELFDQLIVAKDQISLLTSIESNAHTLKSSAKILGFKEIGLLAEKIEESGEKLKNLNIHIGISVIDEMRNVLEIIKKLRNGIKIGINDIQNASQRLNEAINGQMPSKRSSSRELGEFEQLFIDETLDKVIRINEKMEHHDPLEDISTEFNNIKRSAALVGFNRIKNLATVSEQLCDISKDKNAVYIICQDVTNEIKNACERILSGNYENIGQIDELISKVNQAIKDTEHDAKIDLTKDVESFRDVLHNTSEKISNRIAFVQKINRLKQTLKSVGQDDTTDSAVDDLMFITERLNDEISDNIKHANSFNEQVKRQFFQFGDHGEVVCFTSNKEPFALDNSNVSSLATIESLNDDETTTIEDKSYSFKYADEIVGNSINSLKANERSGVILKNDSLIISSESPYKLMEAQIAQIGDLKSIDHVALTQDNMVHFIINPSI